MAVPLVLGGEPEVIAFDPGQSPRMEILTISFRLLTTGRGACRLLPSAVIRAKGGDDDDTIVLAAERAAPERARGPSRISSEVGHRTPPKPEPHVTG